MSDDIRVGLVRVADVQFHPHNTRTDLGDLRGLAQSIATYGVMQPIVVERYGDQLRLRAGHRRLAAATMIALPRIPAIIHADALGEREWIEHSIQENAIRDDMAKADRKRAIHTLRQLGCTWDGIGDTFGVSAQTIRAWLADTDDTPAPVADKPAADPARRRRSTGPSARARAVARLIEAHCDEFDAYLTEAKTAEGRNA